jgi:hypothetical protein
MLLCYRSYILPQNLTFRPVCINPNTLICVRNNICQFRVFYHLKIHLHIFQLAIEVFLYYFLCTFSSELAILVKITRINVVFWLNSPLQNSIILFTLFISSVKAITVWTFFNTLSIKDIVFKSTIIINLFRVKIAILCLSGVFFHATRIIRTIIQYVKAWSFRKPIRKLAYKQRPVFFIHFSQPMRSTDLN